MWRFYLYSLLSSLNHLQSRLHHHILKFILLFVKVIDTIPVSPATDKTNNDNVRVSLRKFISYWKPIMMCHISDVIYTLYLDYNQVLYSHNKVSVDIRITQIKPTLSDRLVRATGLLGLGPECPLKEINIAVINHGKWGNEAWGKDALQWGEETNT